MVGSALAMNVVMLCSHALERCWRCKAKSLLNMMRLSLLRFVRMPWVLRSTSKVGSNGRLLSCSGLLESCFKVLGGFLEGLELILSLSGSGFKRGFKVFTSGDNPFFHSRVGVNTLSKHVRHEVEVLAEVVVVLLQVRDLRLKLEVLFPPHRF